MKRLLAACLAVLTISACVAGPSASSKLGTSDHAKADLSCEAIETIDVGSPRAQAFIKIVNLSGHPVSFSPYGTISMHSVGPPSKVVAFGIGFELAEKRADASRPAEQLLNLAVDSTRVFVMTLEVNQSDIRELADAGASSMALHFYVESGDPLDPCLVKGIDLQASTAR